MTPDPKALIDEIMAATGLSIAGIAEKIGLSERSIRNVYYGQAPLTARNGALLTELRDRQVAEEPIIGDPKIGDRLANQAAFIQDVMKQHDLSVEELAARLLIKPETMKKYARGYQPASERLMMAIRQVSEGVRTAPAMKPEVKLKSVRALPVISRAQAGHLGSWEELPTEWQSSIPSDCPDPKAFALELDGDSMEPQFRAGDIVVVMPSFRPYNESLVVAKLMSGDVSFKRMVFDDIAGERVQLISYNPLYPTRTFETEHHLEWIYPVYSATRNLWNEERWKSQHQAMFGNE